MAKLSDETLAIAIPAELKTEHPDADLVVKGIIIAIAAAEEGITARKRMQNVHDALKSLYVPMFQAHIAKEDEDWNSLRSRAALAPEPVELDLNAEFPHSRYEKVNGKTRIVSLPVKPDAVVSRAREAGFPNAFWTTDMVGGKGILYSGTKEDGYPFYVFTEKD